jgi:hypothetical protein
MQGKSLSEFLQNKEAMQIVFAAEKSTETKKRIHLHFNSKTIGETVLFETEFFPFTNIANKEVEFYVCTHRVMLN